MEELQLQERACLVVQQLEHREAVLSVSLVEVGEHRQQVVFLVPQEETERRQLVGAVSLVVAVKLLFLHLELEPQQIVNQKLRPEVADFLVVDNQLSLHQAVEVDSLVVDNQKQLLLEEVSLEELHNLEQEPVQEACLEKVELQVNLQHQHLA